MSGDGDNLVTAPTQSAMACRFGSDIESDSGRVLRFRFTLVEGSMGYSSNDRAEWTDRTGSGVKGIIMRQDDGNRGIGAEIVPRISYGAQRCLVMKPYLAIVLAASSLALTPFRAPFSHTLYSQSTALINTLKYHVIS